MQTARGTPCSLPQSFRFLHAYFAGCYELYAMLCGEQRSFWQESKLCVSDLGTRIAQRLSAVVEVSRPPNLAQHGKLCIEGDVKESVASQEQLHTERWQSCDLDMEQQFGEMSIFGKAS